MTRITHFNPPADIASLLGDSLNVNRGTRYAAASAYPSNHQLRTSPPKMPWSHPYNLGQAAVAAWRALPEAERQRQHAAAKAEGRSGWNRFISEWLAEKG